jgi:hypothetical protein
MRDDPVGSAPDRQGVRDPVRGRIDPLKRFPVVCRDPESAKGSEHVDRHAIGVHGRKHLARVRVDPGHDVAVGVADPEAAVRRRRIQGSAAPRSKVAVSLPAAGSILESVASSWFTAQIAPNPAAIPSGYAPTGMRSTTRFVAGSMRATRFSVSSTAQIEPNASTRSMGEATWTVAITLAVAGSTRSRPSDW